MPVDVCSDKYSCHSWPLAVSYDAVQTESDCTHRYKGLSEPPEELILVRTRSLVAAYFFAFAAVQYLLAETLTARMFDGYSYTRDTVSELGVPAVSHWHALMNLSFWMSAVSVLVAGICSAHLLGGRRRYVYLALIVAYSIGSVLVATVHGGDGSAHFVGAFLAICGGNAIALVVGTAFWSTEAASGCLRWYSMASKTLGATGFFVSVLLVAQVGPVGAVERATIYTFVAWEILTAVTIGMVLFRSRGKSERPTVRR